MRIHSPLLIVAAALLSTVTGLLSTGAEAPSQDGAPRGGLRTAPMKSVAAPNPRLVELQGAWELVRIESPAANDPSFRQTGMMLVTDGFLSIELHLGKVDAGKTELFETYFQSGTHRMEIDHRDNLVLTSVIGASVDSLGVVVFEEPGRRRLYSFEVSGDVLMLKNLERQARLYFRRVEHVPVVRDLYGREVRTAPAPEPTDEN